MKKGTIASGLTMASSVMSGLTRSMAGVAISACLAAAGRSERGGSPLPSARDVQEGAGDVAGVFGQQPDDAAGDLLRTAGALHRHGGSELEGAIGHAAR